MSAREKSDLPEVAWKRANKAASAAAERAVERRGRAKENAEHGPDAEPGRLGDLADAVGAPGAAFRAARICLFRSGSIRDRPNCLPSSGALLRPLRISALLDDRSIDCSNSANTPLPRPPLRRFADFREIWVVHT